MPTLREAATAMGVPYRTAAWWIEKGLIRPKGYKHRQRVPVPLTEKEMGELLVLARLRNLLSLQKLRAAMSYLRKQGHNPLTTSGKWFAVVGGKPKERRLVRITDEGHAFEIIGEVEQPLLIPLFDKSELVSRGDK